MSDLGRCPMCGAPIVRTERNPDAHEPYVPAVMYICQRGHRITQPEETAGS